MAQNRVREYRKARGITQRELARKSGISLRTIVGIENGANCQRPTARKIVFALGMPFEEITKVFPQQIAPGPYRARSIGRARG